MPSAEDKNRETNHPLAAQQRQPASLARVLVVLASVVVVCAGMYVAAGPILNPIFFALTLALIFSPVYGWLRRRLPTLLALVIMIIGLVALTFGLVMLLSTSLSRFTAELSYYAAQWDDQLARLQAGLDELGLTTIDLSSVFDPSLIATVLGTIAGAILSFVGDLFLILVLVLFFLAEGPAMMRRLQASVEGNHPRIERLFAVGKGVTRQFALRAVVNLATGAGVILLLLVVGVLVLNLLAENALSPYLMGRGLNLSPTVVFFSFIFWVFLLGAPGAFLAMPLTLFLVVMLSTYPEASWLVSLMVAQVPTTTEEAP